MHFAFKETHGEDEAMPTLANGLDEFVSSSQLTGMGDLEALQRESNTTFFLFILVALAPLSLGS